MFDSTFKAPRVLSLILYSLSAMTVMMTIAPDTSASKREYAVGFSKLFTSDPMGGKMLYALWYPTNVPNGTYKVGPFELPGTQDAEPAVGQFGFVILSHGSGGSPLSHWDTAFALVKAGFIVAGPLHPRNNSRDDTGSHQRIVLDGRPRQISAVIDALLAQRTWSSRIDTRKIAAFGFSAGGYTILAALGAERNYSRINDHCERHAKVDPYCGITNPNNHSARYRDYIRPTQRTYDDRLCAAVIADLFATPFSDAALKALPPAKLLFFRPKVEDVLKAEFHTSRVVRLLKQRDDFPDTQEIVVKGAKHLSFLAPKPEVVVQSNPKIASDPEGFDRAAFHNVMNSTIVAFFREAFVGCAGS